jgi:hypothetical protein
MCYVSALVLGLYLIQALMTVHRNGFLTDYDALHRASAHKRKMKHNDLQCIKV